MKTLCYWIITIFQQTDTNFFINRKHRFTFIYICVVCASLLHLCLTVCDPMVCSPPGSSVRGILQARILEWVAMSSFRGSSPPRDWICAPFVSCIAGRFFTTVPPGTPLFIYKYVKNVDFPRSSVSKASACNAGDLGSIPGLGRSSGEGKGDPLQYSGLESSIDCIVHGVTKSQTWLSNFWLLLHDNM